MPKDAAWMEHLQQESMATDARKSPQSDLHWWCRWKLSSSWEPHGEETRTSSPVGLPPAAQETHLLTHRSRARIIKSAKQRNALRCRCLSWIFAPIKSSCCTACFVYNSASRQQQSKRSHLFIFFTWFSVAFSLGILLPAVVGFFFPLVKGMVGSLTVRGKKNKKNMTGSLYKQNTLKCMIFSFFA